MKKAKKLASCLNPYLSSNRLLPDHQLRGLQGVEPHYRPPKSASWSSRPLIEQLQMIS